MEYKIVICIFLSSSNAVRKFLVNFFVFACFFGSFKFLCVFFLLFMRDMWLFLLIFNKVYFIWFMIGILRLCEDGTSFLIFLLVKISSAVKWYFACLCFFVFDVVILIILVG